MHRRPLRARQPAAPPHRHSLGRGRRGAQATRTLRSRSLEMRVRRHDARRRMRGGDARSEVRGALSRHSSGVELRFRPPPSCSGSAVCGAPSGAVVCDHVKVQYPRARARPHGAPASLFAVERGSARAQGTHHVGRQVVLPIDAAWIAAGHEEEGGSAVDYDPPCVGIGPNARTFLDVEPKADQVGNLLAKPRRLVFAPTSFRESLGLRTISSPEVHHWVQRNHSAGGSLARLGE